jgi:hypothetical protein
MIHLLKIGFKQENARKWTMLQWSGVKNKIKLVLEPLFIWKLCPILRIQLKKIFNIILLLKMLEEIKLFVGMTDRFMDVILIYKV